MSGPGLDLTRVKFTISDMIPCALPEVWRRVLAWTRLGEWQMPAGPTGEALTSCHLAGSPPDGCLGCQRVITIGGASYAEELLAVDSVHHSLTYMGINAQGAENPFPGTLLDYSGALKLLPITVSSHTYFEWTMEFSTEPQSAVLMEKALGDWIASCFSGMKRACALSSTSRLPTAPPYRAPIGSMPQPRVGHRPASNPNMHDPTGFQRPNPWHTSLEGHMSQQMSQASLNDPALLRSSLGDSARLSSNEDASPVTSNAGRQRRFKVAQFPPQP